MSHQVVPQRKIQGGVACEDVGGVGTANRFHREDAAMGLGGPRECEAEQEEARHTRLRAAWAALATLRLRAAWAALAALR